MLTIQAVKGYAANIVTFGDVVAATTSHDDDHVVAGQLNQGSGLYTVLISKQLAQTAGAELYSATVNCVGYDGRKPTTTVSSIKQNQ